MRRKAIKLQPHEDHQLRQLYLAFRIPSDQYAQRPRALARFINEWNELSGRSDNAGEVIHYIITQRKQKLWVTFDGDYDPLRSPGVDDFTAKEWAALEAAYTEIDQGRDNYAADPSLRDLLAEKFSARTKKYISGNLLYAAAMARQKRGEWPHVTPPKEPGIGFRDIDEVA
jgi:hypothetical protein